ncbi:MAG: YbaB/EbfC family nucleoid-associated protein [Deltaproteobacteria bacterium]|jgi:DNA-binding YbaB/EbfC family protein|nr:YbaB/EbfC family nucleoid-associated protein [Deltaproteobacteria bacterium]
MAKGPEMPGGLDLGGLMQAAQQMQQDMERAQEELARKTVEGSAGGGMVVAIANGKQELVSLKIEKAVVDPSDIGMLQDLVVAACNVALRKAAELAAETMQGAAGGLAGALPPGLSGLLGGGR